MVLKRTDCSMRSPFVIKHAWIIKRVAQTHGAARVRVFGSHADGKVRKRSDLDLLVKFSRGRDLFDLIGIKLDLEKQLGCKVDVVSERGLSPFLRDKILKQASQI